MLQHEYYDSTDITDDVVLLQGYRVSETIE